MGNARTRFGLLPKIIVFLAAVLIPLAAVTWYASVRTLRAQMTEEFTSKGTAIANSLASSGVDLILNRDASTVQARVDEVISGKDAISGVAYVMVYDPQKTLIAHTFHPIVPPDLIDKNLVPGETPKQVREIHYAHPVTGAMRSIIDVGVPMLAGQLGTVRVGMDKAIIEAAAAKPGWYLLLMFGGVALLAVMAGAVFARRITRPLGEIVRAAEQVGRGDLSHTVRVRSHDEIGQLLTGLKLMMATSAGREGRENGASAAQAAERQEMAAIVNELIGRLRDLSMNLRPPMLDQIGLVPALQWHFERYTTRTKVRVFFTESVHGFRFPEDVEIAAFRIIQEALTNVARHAGVEEAYVEVEAERDSLKLLIEDKGQGFNERDAVSGRSAGIIGMQERAHLVGGHLTLETEIRGGTRITVVLPLRNHEEWSGEPDL